MSHHKNRHPLSSPVPTERGGKGWGSLSSSFDLRQEQWYPDIGLVIRLLLLSLFFSFSPPFFLSFLLTSAYPKCILWSWLSLPASRGTHCCRPSGAGHCHSLGRAPTRLCRVCEGLLCRMNAIGSLKYAGWELCREQMAFLQRGLGPESLG